MIIEVLRRLLLVFMFSSLYIGSAVTKTHSVENVYVCTYVMLSHVFLGILTQRLAFPIVNCAATWPQSMGQSMLGNLVLTLLLLYTRCYFAHCNLNMVIVFLLRLYLLYKLSF